MTDYSSSMLRSKRLVLSRPPTSHALHTRRLLTVLLGIVAVGACESNATDPAVSAAAGNYVLRTINDTNLPYTVTQTTGYHIDITAETLGIALDGTFLDITRLRQTDSTNASIFSADTLDGYIQVSGPTVTFINGQQILGQAVLQGSTLTLSGSGVTSVYTR